MLPKKLNIPDKELYYQHIFNKPVGLQLKSWDELFIKDFGIYRAHNHLAVIINNMLYFINEKGKLSTVYSQKEINGFPYEPMNHVFYIK